MRAREISYTCRTFTGIEAAAIGLVNLVVPDEALDTEVERLAPPDIGQFMVTYRANKRLFNETDGLPLSAGLAHEIRRTEGRGPDMHDRIAAFNKTICQSLIA